MNITSQYLVTIAIRHNRFRCLILFWKLGCAIFDGTKLSYRNISLRPSYLLLTSEPAEPVYSMSVYLTSLSWPVSDAKAVLLLLSRIRSLDPRQHDFHLISLMPSVLVERDRILHTQWYFSCRQPLLAECRFLDQFGLHPTSFEGERVPWITI